MNVVQVLVPFDISIESCMDCGGPSEHLYQSFHSRVPADISRTCLFQIPQDLANISLIFLFPMCTVSVIKAVGSVLAMAG